MGISLQACILLLKEHHLLKSSAVQNDTAVEMSGIAYDSRKVDGPTLFFCKGAKFRPTYLLMAKENGATTYVAEKPYVEGNGLNALIVVNITKAMAILSAAFYDFPQDDLHVVAYTGTQGKTTAAYFTRGILEAARPKHVALFSSIDRIVGSGEGEQFRSDLSTPESMDLFHDMRTAVDNGMTNLVMEVSSQAYLRNRVFGLTYDVGVFLNITPDHIGPDEHRDFTDYLHSKIQMIVNSRKVVINAETEHFDDIYGAARATTRADSVYLYASATYKPKRPDVQIDFRYDSHTTGTQRSEFTLIPVTDKAVMLNVGGNYCIQVTGDYNESNATAAIIGAGLAGVDATTAAAGLSRTTIPGRMEEFSIPGHGHVYVDYAHNYASMKAVLSFINAEFNNPRLLVVLGSTGDRGFSRRSDFARALNEYADDAYLTTDNPGFESPESIVSDIREGIDVERVKVHEILDREAAITEAIAASRPEDIVLIAGKGAEDHQRVRGINTPWMTDAEAVRQAATKLV